MDNSHTVIDGVVKTRGRRQTELRTDVEETSHSIQWKAKGNVFLHKSLIRKNMAAWTMQLTWQKLFSLNISVFWCTYLTDEGGQSERVLMQK